MVKMLLGFLVKDDVTGRFRKPVGSKPGGRLSRSSGSDRTTGIADQHLAK
jgi:hypothetical protein